MRTGTKIKFEYVPLALLILILGLVAGSELFPEYRKHTWSFVFIAFAVVSCISSYFFQHRSSFGKHLVLWFGALGALMTVFVFEYAGLINANQMAMFTLVLLGFATFSSGLYGSIGESGIGLLLLAYAVMMAILEEYLWLVWLFILALVMLQLFRLKKGKPSAPAPEQGAGAGKH